MQIPKGLNTKNEVLEQARVLLNEEGLGFTLMDLARKLNTTSGRITYHFPTKDDLFIALAQKYEEVQKNSRGSGIEENFGLHGFYKRAAQAMDIQFEHRCVIRYLASSSKTQGKLFEHLTATFRENRGIIEKLFSKLVTDESLEPSILDPENFKIIFFQFTSLFTTWVINFEIYDSDRTFEEMKPIYLKGIFSCFNPYLTSKGKAELYPSGIES